MSGQRKLHLHEEVLLLALRDEKGTVAGGTMYQHGLAGAILAELLLRQKIRLDSSRRRPLVEAVPGKAPVEPVLRDCLDRIRNAKRRASLKTWVGRFANTRRLKHRIAQRLCKRGILRAEEDRVLLLFTRKTYPELDGAPEREIIARLRQAIFTASREVEPRTAVLVSLAHRTGLLKVAFDRKRLKSRKKRIEQVINGEVVGQATRQAIEAMQAAIIAACIVPVIASTSCH